MNHPCLNNGECFDNYGSYVCQCPPGYDGTNCEQDLKECQSSPCENGGSCVDEVGSYHCSCPSEFTGKHCEIRQNNVCLPDEIGIPPNCSINYCSNNPCINGGLCNNDKDGYKCICPSGWKGKY